MKLFNLVKTLIGLILILASIYAVVMWWLPDFLTMLKGGLPIFVFLTGLIFLILGFEK